MHWQNVSVVYLIFGHITRLCTFTHHVLHIYKLLFLWMCTSTHHVLCIYKLLFSSFRGVALTKCFSSLFNFGQISMFEKGITPKKKKSNQNFLSICRSPHYYFITTNFAKSCLAFSEEKGWQTVLVVYQ